MTNWIPTRNMPTNWPSRLPMTGAGVAMAAIAEQKIATTVKGFIDYELHRIRTKNWQTD